MKKKITLILFGLLFSAGIFAQSIPTCKPIANLPDTAVGVFPLPYDAKLAPKGGISDTACLNTYFQFPFTIAVPATFNVAGIGALPINSIALNPKTAVGNLPAGLQYVCNPPSCVFLRATKGCVVLYGSPTDAATVGRNDLKITGLVNTVIPIEVTFPSAQISTPGNYYLFIRPKGSPACKPLSTDDLLAATKLKVTNWPNPFSGSTQIEIDSELRGRFDLRVFDLLGKMISRQPLDLIKGINRVTYEAENLMPGIYVYSITDGFNTVSRKMVVERN
jgi:hypothetical protein